MAFAYTTAVAGAGTVSCTGTTTVTGTGTTFATVTGVAAGANHARVGGTITVGANTRTIVAIASTTSLTVDTAFPSFTGQAFTVQTGITQTGVDSLNLSVGSATGFLITNRGDLFRTFDVRGCDLSINGTLTVDSTIAQLRNDGSCNNTFVVNGSVSGGEIIFDGRKATANNAPYPYPGFDWLGTSGLKILYLTGTDAYPGKFRLRDACVRFGADWLTTYSVHRSVISTEGSNCWILPGKGTGTGLPRIRQENQQASINFQATKTWIGVWMNFGVAQTSLSGYTPINTDGPEINASIISISPRIQIPNYDTTYVKAAYYTGSEITLYAGAWINLKNNLKGTNIVWQSVSSGGATYNVIEYSKQIKAVSKDSLGNVLNDGYLYFQPVGSNASGVKARGGSSNITFDLSQKSISVSGGLAETEFIYAWDYANTDGLKSTTKFFCSGQTKGAETHPAFLSRYGYDKQPITISLSGNNTFEVSASHTSLPTTDKIIANAEAIRGISFNFSTKVMDIAVNAATVQRVYDKFQYQLNQVENLQVVDTCTIDGVKTTYTGWTVNLAGPLAAGTGLTHLGATTINVLSAPTSLFDSGGVWTENGRWTDTMVWGASETLAPATFSNINLTANVNFVTPVDLTGVNITGNLTYNTDTDITITLTDCTVTGTISNTGTGTVTITNLNSTLGTIGANVSTRLYALVTISSVLAGSTIAVYDGAGTEFGLTTNSGTSYTYDATGGTGTWTWVIEYYGKVRQTGTFTPVTGETTVTASFAPDFFITQTTQATVAAYTSISDLDKLYDYAAYMRTQQPKYVLAVKDGSTVDFGATSMNIDATAASVWSYNSTTDLLTVKSSVLAAATRYTLIKSTNPITFLNGATATCIYVDDEGSSTNVVFSNL